MCSACILSGCSQKGKTNTDNQKSTTSDVKETSEKVAEPDDNTNKETDGNMVLSLNSSNFDLNKPFEENALKKLNAKELSILRNSIYAKYGYIFSEKEYKEYFSKVAWYKPTNKNVETKLNSVDKQNISEITALEKKSQPLQYKNSKLGFSITFPESWKDKYTIKEYDKGMTVYFKTKATISGGNGRMFDIVKNPSQELNGLFDDVQYIKINGANYLIGKPTDVTYEKGDPEYDVFSKMKSEIPEVIKTIK